MSTVANPGPADRIHRPSLLRDRRIARNRSASRRRIIRSCAPSTSCRRTARSSAARPVPGNLPYLSNSQIAKWRWCPVQNYLHYVEDLREPENSALCFGSWFHEAMHAALILRMQAYTAGTEFNALHALDSARTVARAAMRATAEKIARPQNEADLPERERSTTPGRVSRLRSTLQSNVQSTRCCRRSGQSRSSKAT